MLSNEPIKEIDVLLATTFFLVQRGVTPYQFSIAHGKEINYQEHLEKVLQPFRAIGREPIISTTGPDIMGLSENEWWQIECKSSGSGKKQTQRNNFDRALASIVSYYEEDLSNLEIPEEFKDTKPYLGLALPATPEYLTELKRRVRKPLRTRLNLWILLYDPDTKLIRPISPIEDY